MTDPVEPLRRDLRNWQVSLELTDLDPQPGLGDEPEELLARLRRAVTGYRLQVLPYLQAERELVLPALLSDDDAPLAIGCAATLAAELGDLVDRIEAVRTELLRYPVDHSESTRIRARAVGLLTAAGALCRVAARFSGEIVLPALSEQLGQHGSGQLVDAVHAYERALR